MTSRILFEWTRENTFLTTDLLVDSAVFESSFQVFEVRDLTSKQLFFESIGNVEKQGMRLLSTIKQPGTNGLVFCFASAVRADELDRKWRDLGTFGDTTDVYKFYLDRLVPPDFATTRKTLDAICKEVLKTMNGGAVVNLHFHVIVDHKRANALLKIAKEQNWTTTSDEVKGNSRDIVLSSRINREYLQALGELSTVFVSTKQMDAKLVGFGIEKDN